MNKKDENVEIIKLVNDMSDEEIEINIQKMISKENGMILNLNYFEKSQTQRVIDALSNHKNVQKISEAIYVITQKKTDC